MDKYDLQAVCANGIGLIILFSLFLNLRGKYDKKKDEYYIFTWMLIVNILQCIIEPITIIIDGRLFKGAILLSTVLNSLLFLNNIIFAMLWVIYADLRLRSFNIKTSNKYLLIFIPGILVIFGIILNLFFPIFFMITPDNVYQRTGIYIITYIITYFYLVWGMLTAYIIRRKKDKYVFLPAFNFILPIFLASVLQLVFQGVSLLWGGAAIGLMSAYLSLQDERASVDPLSGVFTRHYMNQYLDSLCKRTPSNQRISGIMLDIDKFKTINDQYGHLIGDEVIHKFGAILKNAVNGKGIVFRYAGDEFVVIVINYDKAQLIALTNAIYAELDKVNAEENVYKIACSLGYATYIPGETPNHFLKRMDDAMYTNKNNKRRKEGGKYAVEDEELIYAGIDLPDLLNRLMQNKTLIRVFVKKFLEDKSYDRLCAAVEKNDLKQVEFEAHSLKGMCGNLSLKTLYELFSEQVRLVRGGEGERATYMMAAINEEYKNAVDNMEGWLSKQVE